MWRYAIGLLSVCLSVLSVTLVYCSQTVGRIKMKLGMHVGLGPGHIMLDRELGTQLPLPQRGTAPQFSAHICCGQMAAWIKMSLCMELGLSQGKFVLDGDHAHPSQKGGGAPQIFRLCLLRPNGWMDEAGTWHGVMPQPRRLCQIGTPLPLPKRGAEHPPNFRPMFIVAKQLDE